MDKQPYKKEIMNYEDKQCDTCGKWIKINEHYFTRPGDIICEYCMDRMIRFPYGNQNNY